MTKIISRPSTPEYREGYDKINWNKSIICEKCHGKGWLLWHEFGPPLINKIDDTKYLCDKCNGKGTIKS